MDEDVCGIDLQESNQLALMSELAKYQTSFPFPKEKTADFRYTIAFTICIATAMGLSSTQ